MTTTSNTTDDETYCINYDSVLAAHQRIEPYIHRTPVLTCASLDRISSASPSTNSNDAENHDNSPARSTRLFFKVEAMQKTGSFKFRGALNAVLKLTQEQQSTNDNNDKDKEVKVVTHSSGNFAQALAHSASVASTPHSNVTATIVMPRGAPSVKQSAVRGYGGQVVLVDNTNEARESKAAEIELETGAEFIHPSEDPLVIAGQGTSGLELVHQVEDMVGRDGERILDVVVIPVGGGGLASGNCMALRGKLGDQVKIVLAEPEQLDDAKRSIEAGERLPHHPSNLPLSSVADGLKTTLGPHTWPIVRDFADDIYTVSEKQILQATKLIWERLKICVEPSAGTAAAVVLLHEGFKKKYGSNGEGGSEQRVGVILSGGNVDVIKVAKMMQDVGL